MQKLNIVGNSLQHINWYTLCIWYAIVTFMCSLRYTHWIFVLFSILFFLHFVMSLIFNVVICIYLIGLRLVRIIIILFVETLIFFSSLAIFLSLFNFIWHSNIVFRRRRSEKEKRRCRFCCSGDDVELIIAYNCAIIIVSKEKCFIGNLKSDLLMCREFSQFILFFMLAYSWRTSSVFNFRNCYHKKFGQKENFAFYKYY